MRVEWRVCQTDGSQYVFATGKRPHLPESTASMLSIVSSDTPSRIAIRNRAGQKAGVKDEPPAKRRIRLGKLWWWMVGVFATLIGWQMWELHLYNAAVREAKEAGFIWKCDDTISLIRQDWHNALKKETWGEHPRVLKMEVGNDLGHYREMLHQLRPTVLDVRGCKDENVDALKGLTDLQYLELFNCPALQNVDALNGLTGLQTLQLPNCDALQNVDAIESLTGLQRLDLSSCRVLQNVDALKGLTGLQFLDLIGCDKISAVALRELRAALPNTYIIFPDGSKNPPQE